MKPPALGFLCAHAEGMIEYNILYRSEDSIARNGWVTGFEFVVGEENSNPTLLIRRWVDGWGLSSHGIGGLITPSIYYFPHKKHTK